ncbi:hypothetical protein XELAEV_18004275mg [Xenopus laevis]|uniref:Ig-like domain-containing protein n=1 Tax=Xenopus laevis TaxID=8355 RepID=A0A974BRW8_XENLA|nr:hypothetical protein XELAEV_18004275mg [Xenopus laevis]
MKYLPNCQDHGTELICDAIHPNWKISKKLAVLNIKYDDKDVTIKGKNKIEEGKVLQLECHFSDYNTTNSHYSYSWYLNGNPVNGQTGRILQINNITKSRSGNYSCIVQNRGRSFYSPWFAVTVMSAQTGDDLPMGVIIGGVAGSVLVILLILGLYLFYRKSQKLEASGGRRVETNIQVSL